MQGTPIDLSFSHIPAQAPQDELVAAINRNTGVMETYLQDRDGARELSRYQSVGGFVSNLGHTMAYLGGDPETSEAIMYLGSAGTKITAGAMTDNPILIADGLMDLVKAFSGRQAQPDLRHRQVMEALYQLGQMIQRNFELVHDRLYAHSLQLYQIQGSLIGAAYYADGAARTIFSQKFVALMSDSNSALKEVGGRFSNEEIRKLLLKLARWGSAESHIGADILTGKLRAEGTMSPIEHVTILNRKFNVHHMLGYLQMLLGQNVPHDLTPNMQKLLPNIDILLRVTMAYGDIIKHYKPIENYQAPLEDLAKSWQVVIDFVDALKSNDAMWNSLFRQHRKYQRLLGDQIGHCFATYGDLASSPDSAKERLKMLIAEAEMRRLLMDKLCILAGNPPKFRVKVNALPSCNKVWEKSRADYDRITAEALEVVRTANFDQALNAFNEGANINATNNYDTIAHYVTRLPDDSLYRSSQEREIAHRILEEVLSAPSYNGGVGNRETGRDTWGSGSGPSRCAMNNGLFEQAILFCAHGRDFILYDGDFYNSLRPDSLASSHALRIQKSLVEDMNDPAGWLFKEHLRKAYQFYRASYDADHGAIDKLIDDVKPHMVLWITALLGDMTALKTLEKRGKVVTVADANRAIDSLTPMLLAARLGRKDLVIHLADRGVSCNDLCELLSNGSMTTSAIDLAIDGKFWDTAQALLDKGCTAKDGQAAQISQALAEVQVAGGAGREAIAQAEDDVENPYRPLLTHIAELSHIHSTTLVDPDKFNDTVINAVSERVNTSHNKRIVRFVLGDVLEALDEEHKTVAVMMRLGADILRNLPRGHLEEVHVRTTANNAIHNLLNLPENAAAAAPNAQNMQQAAPIFQMAGAAAGMQPEPAPH
jgi:hypothetical protein